MLVNFTTESKTLSIFINYNCYIDNKYTFVVHIVTHESPEKEN